MIFTRYQIWNGTDDIYTPSGERFTAGEWAERYPWAKIPGAKMIITTGLINGGAAMEYGAAVSAYKAQGAAITDGMSVDEVLAAIEDFEDNPPGAGEPSSEERIAAAMEAQVMMAEPEVMAAALSDAPAAVSARSSAGPSPAFARVKRNFERGLWSASIVRAAAVKGYVTEDEAGGILSGATA